MQADCKKTVALYQENIRANLSSARAIVDCVRVLTSLERMPVSNDHPGNGEGYANGNCTADSSMATALFHAISLLNQADQATTEVCRIAFGTSEIEQRS